MDMLNLNYPLVYFDGSAWQLAPDNKRSNTYFGGPSDFQPEHFVGLEYGPHPLQHILTISWQQIPPLREIGLTSLPFYYGIQYEGCELGYEIARAGYSEFVNIEVLDPKKSSSDYPYANYPALLPYVPLKVGKRMKLSAAKFDKLTWQGCVVEKGVLAVLVPAVDLHGVSMWGPGGCYNQIIFRYDTKEKIFIGTSQCD